MQAAPDTSPAWRAVLFSAVCVLAKKKGVCVCVVDGWVQAPFGGKSKAVSKEKKQQQTYIHTQTTHGVG